MSRHPAVLVKELEATLTELVKVDLDSVDDATVLADVLVDLMPTGLMPATGAQQEA